MAQASVKITAAMTEYQAAMKAAVASMKQLSSEYSLAAANAKLYGTQSDALRAKITELTQKMEVQKTKVKECEKQHETLTTRLKNQQTRHETLKQRVEDLSKAYEESKEATGEDSEETKKLEEQLKKAEKQLATTEKQIKNSETAIKNQEAAVTKANAELAEMEVQLREVNAELARQKFDSYAEKAGKVGSALEGAGRIMTRASVAIAGVATAAVKTTADFEAQMSRVQAISGATGEDLQALEDQAIQLGASTKFSASEAAQGMENLASAGFSTQEIMAAMPGMLDLAAASGEDLAASSDIAASTLRGFGLEAEQAGHVADVLAKNAADTNAAVADTGEAMKYVAPVAAAMGISFEECAAAIGIMSDAGIKGSQAGTSLRGALSRLAKPTEQMQAKMDELGLSFFDSEGKMLSLKDMTAMLQDRLSGLSDEQRNNALVTIFGQESLSGMLALMQAGSGRVDELTQSYLTCDGAAAEMADTMQNNLKGQIEELSGTVETIAITIGNILLPYIKEAVDKIQEWANKFLELDEEQQKTIIKIAAVVAAIGPLLLVVGKLIIFSANVSSAIGTLAAHFAKTGAAAAGASGSTGLLSGAIAAITSPIGIAVAAIAGIAAVIATLWNTNEEFRTSITETWDRIKQAFIDFGQGITDRLNALGFDFENFGEVVKTIWTEFCNVLAPIIEGAFSAVATVLETVFDVILGIFDLFANLFQGNWSGVWDAVKGIFESIWNMITGILQTAVDILTGILDVFLGWFGTSWNEVWTSIKTFFEGVWNGIVTFFTNIWTTISTTVTTWMTNIWNTISSIFTTCRDFVMNVFQTIQNVITVVIMAIAEFFNTAIQIITLPFQFIWQNCKDIVTAAWDAISTKIQTVLTAVNNVITTVWNAVSQFFTTIWNTIKNTVSTVWDAISTKIQTVLNAIKSVVTNAWNAVKTTITNAVNNVKTTVSNVFNAVKTTVSNVFNSIKSTASSVWNAIKNAIQTPINAAKSTVSSVVNGIKLTVSSVFNGIRSTATSVWNSIKNAITTPINAARDAVRNAINKIKSFFNFSWSLPRLKLPHISISGKFSLSPPSVPHFSISWYKNGAIMDAPMIFGMNGNTLLAGGEPETGGEAILPLAPFYTRLNEILDAKLEAVKRATNITVENHTYIDSEEVASRTVTKVDEKMTEDRKKVR